MDRILFWMKNSPDPVNINQAQWELFRADMAGALYLYWILFVVVIVGAYAWHSWTKKIGSPADLFDHYTPLRWLWVSFAPAILLFITYTTRFNKTFPGTTASPTWSALAIALLGGVLTFVIAHLIILVPGVTPAKYRYRPWWMLYSSAGVKKT